jgi:hypothetical protein
LALNYVYDWFIFCYAPVDCFKASASEQMSHSACTLHNVSRDNDTKKKR